MSSKEYGRLLCMMSFLRLPCWTLTFNTRLLFPRSESIADSGTTMGPKSTYSYADLVMRDIDLLAKQGSPIKPNYWWRYRDDILDIWTQGLDKLFEFTDFNNSLYPTIKFELVYPTSQINVLDLTLNLKEGFIYTNIYAKLTDSHLYLHPRSSHPRHEKKAIPLRVALRIKRNCSSDVYF